MKDETSLPSGPKKGGFKAYLLSKLSVILAAATGLGGVIATIVGVSCCPSATSVVVAVASLPLYGYLLVSFNNMRKGANKDIDETRQLIQTTGVEFDLTTLVKDKTSALAVKGMLISGIGLALCIIGKGIAIKKAFERPCTEKIDCDTLCIVQSVCEGGISLIMGGALWIFDPLGAQLRHILERYYTLKEQSQGVIYAQRAIEMSEQGLLWSSPTASRLTPRTAGEYPLSLTADSLIDRRGEKNRDEEEIEMSTAENPSKSPRSLAVRSVLVEARYA